MTTVESIYQNILFKLKADQRPYIVLNSSQINEFLTTLEQSHDIDDQKKILCIFQYCLSHSATLSDFMVSFLQTQINQKNEELLIDCLIGTQNHVIEYSQKRGESPPERYLELLKQCLDSPNATVVHWTLRLIASLGREKKYFEKHIQAIYPSFWAMIFSSQKRENAKLIHYINNALKGSPWNPR